MKYGQYVRRKGRILHTLFQAIQFDFQPQPSNRRLWQLKLLIFPILLVSLGHIYLLYFSEPLMKLFAYTLSTTPDRAAEHVRHRQQTASLILGLFAFCLTFNRMHLTCFTIAFFILGSGQVYDFSHRLMVDRSLLFHLENYQIDYLFMVGNVGNTVRVAFLATIGYGAWATLKKNMELMGVQPR
jgi:hypothetical protein